MSKETDFADIIREHQGLLFKVTSIYTNNAMDRENLFQEIVYQLCKYFDTFRSESKISTWMYWVAMNTAITLLREQSAGPRTLPSWSPCYMQMRVGTRHWRNAYRCSTGISKH